MEQAFQNGVMFGCLVMLCVFGFKGGRAWWRVAFPDALTQALGRTDAVLEAVALTGAAVSVFGLLLWVAS